MFYEQAMLSLIDQMLDAYALHEIIRDKNGKVIDYRFLDINPAFTEMTGLRPEDILGRTVREAIPDIEDHWLERYGRVAETGQTVRFTGYAAPLRKHFEVAAYRPRVNMFAVTFRDVTPEVRAREAIEKALEGSINVIGHVCEVRDPYTAGHQRRVAALAQRMAQAMGLSSEQTKTVYFGALVHDIGKVAVPVEILNYPGALSEPQYGLVKVHPQAGFDILKGVDLPGPVADIVLQHQERMDGSGYPNGLRGDEILLETRIVIVADVFESMNCHRPYRGKHSKEAAIAEIEKNDGRLYDHDVVSICLALAKADDQGFRVECP